jgi:phospholipid/cholesterol/gamma-HCH transport system ATP-binding protein
MFSDAQAHITVRGLSAAYDGRVVLDGLSFSVRRGDIFVVMGQSGSGKSTLLRCMLGLSEPIAGEVIYGDQSFTRASPSERERLLRRFGVLYQNSALFTGMTLLENTAFPLQEIAGVPVLEARPLAELKLALVGLKGFEDFRPAQVSGGMLKRAGLARALALDPEILFLDEPSAGLDPITASRLDELIADLRGSLGTTVVVVSHELASILALGDDSILIDADGGSIAARGAPRQLLADPPNAKAREFLHRFEARHG